LVAKKGGRNARGELVISWSFNGTHAPRTKAGSLPVHYTHGRAKILKKVHGLAGDHGWRLLALQCGTNALEDLHCVYADVVSIDKF
jgi:hypothetical protein